MESADGIEEVKAEAEEAAKEEVSAEETPAEGEGEAAQAEGDVAATTEEQPVTENAQEDDDKGQQLAEENTEDDASDAAIDSEIDDLHKDDLEPIEPIVGDDILTPGDIRNSAVNDVDLTDVAPTPDEELAATNPDETAQPTSDVLEDRKSVV